MSQPSITCPECGATSYHPTDIAEGYCGRCHGFTSRHPSTLLGPPVAQVPPSAIDVTCPRCGAEPQVPCAWAGRAWAGREPVNDPAISHYSRELAAPPE